MKKQFRDAYNWAIKVQRACMFKQVTVEVKSQFCRANYERGNIDAWSLYLWVWREEDNKWAEAQWVAWDPDRFESEKQEIISYLNSKGIKL